ncbi:hypothetical protein [Spiroplasma taiwanense]|uniref:Transmembrane protein n=1 Tax=Spiroplasma taiwanense CT-1 TaxID=1276220 RepID=S5LWD6_9MOLU|nr:hypothetical protein [Spiroplasma taiwanense]AGR40931.1 hypothetical protein STAIW_v1c02670 [Spiroplasma taiwanense CT-1]
MNFNLLAAISGGEQLLILLVILLIAAPLPAMVSWNLALKFRTNKSEEKYINKTLFSIVVLIQSLAILTSILGIIFYFVSIDNESLSKTLVIVFIVLTFVLCASWYSIILFVPQYIWFILEEEKMTTIGDTLKFLKIRKIIDDEEKGIVYINYSEGKKTLKKLKFSKKTEIGLNFIRLADKTGVKIEKGNQIEYFKEELLKLKGININNDSKIIEDNSKQKDSTNLEKENKNSEKNTIKNEPKKSKDVEDKKD